MVPVVKLTISAPQQQLRRHQPSIGTQVCPDHEDDCENVDRAGNAAAAAGPQRWEALNMKGCSH